MATPVTTIQIRVDVRERLKHLGRKGETYNTIIEKLIEKASYVQFMEENYDILDKEQNWVSLEEL